MSLLPISPATTLAAAGTTLGAARALAGAAGGAAAGTFGRLLQAALGAAQPPAAGTPPGPPGAPNAVSPHDVARARQHVEALRTQFLARFRELLAEHGIEDAGTVRLALDEFGELRVDGPHPQSSAIEHVALTSPDLAQLFRDLAAAARRLQTATQALSPAGLRGDLDAALPPFSTGFVPRFVLTISGDSARGTFEA